MSKDKRHNKDEREARIKDNVEMQGRIPTPPPSKYHEVQHKNKKRDRKRSKQDLRELTDECNY